MQSPEGSSTIRSRSERPSHVRRNATSPVPALGWFAEQPTRRKNDTSHNQRRMAPSGPARNVGPAVFLDGRRWTEVPGLARNDHHPPRSDRLDRSRRVRSERLDLFKARFPQQKLELGKRGDGVWMLLVKPDLDRKSTRLNSSHVEISYAVFCLKKKKKK